METSVFKSLDAPQVIEALKREHNLPAVKDYRRNGKGKVLAYVLAENKQTADAVCKMQDYLRNVITHFLVPFAVSSITFLFSFLLTADSMGKATWQDIFSTPVVAISGICVLICCAYFTYLFIRIVQLDRTAGKYFWLANEP